MSAVSQVGLVKNPLTIIAMFAVIAEVSGAIVLPFLSERVQATYVWFLMLFPFTLVVLFFVTLWKKRDALYGPSDYRDEKHFMDALRPATYFELARKNAFEAAEVVSDSYPHAFDGEAQRDEGAGGSPDDSPEAETNIPADPASPGSGSPKEQSVHAQGNSASATPSAESGEDQVVAIRNMRLHRSMRKRAFMKEIALQEATSRFPQVQKDMKVGDRVVDAVAVLRDSVTLIETHYVNGSFWAALEDLNAVVASAREFLASADDTGPLSVLFALYSENERQLNTMYHAITERVRMTNYRGVSVNVIAVKVSQLQLLALKDDEQILPAVAGAGS